MSPILKPNWLSTESYGLLLMLLSAILYAVAGVFVKLAADTGLVSNELVLLRAIFQGAFVIFAMCIYKNDSGVRRMICVPFGDSRYIQKWVVVRGIVGGTGFCLYFYTISKLPLGDATALVALKPVPTIFLGRILLGEQIRLLHILVTILSVAGSVLIAQPSFLFGQEQAQASLGHLTGILGACCAAGVFTLVRKAGSIGAHTLQLLFSWFFFGTLFSIIGILWGHSAKLPPTLESWIYVIAMSIIGSIAHFLLNYAGRLASASLSSIVRSSDLAFAYLFEIIVFHQIPNMYTWTGVGFICLSLVMITLQKIREHRQEEFLDSSGNLKRRSSDLVLSSDDDDDETTKDEEATVVTATEDDSFLEEQHELELQEIGHSAGKHGGGRLYTKVASSDDQD